MTLSRRLPFWLIGPLLVLVMVLAVIAYNMLKPLEGPIPADAGETYIGLEQGTTADGFPRLGRADAPVIVEEFSSYACSHCRDFHDNRFPALVDEIASGQVQWVVIPVPHIGSGAGDAMRAALCAGEQGRFWAMHDTLYSWQGKFLTRVFAPQRLSEGAANLGLNVAAFEACLESERISAQVDLARQIFTQRRLTGTPSFFINGKRVEDYREFDVLGSDPVESEGDS